MSIEENVRRIQEEIAQAAEAAGRDPGEVLLCAATKMNDADAVRRAIAAGVDCCGENRVQELTAKAAQNAYDGAPVHFIGHLQTRCARWWGGWTVSRAWTVSVCSMPLMPRPPGRELSRMCFWR